MWMFEAADDITIHVVPRKYLINSEAGASELLRNLELMCPRFFIVVSGSEQITI